MRLSDTRQSRDECLHGRTQLWASAARKLIVTGGHHADNAVDGSARERLEQAKLEKQTSAEEPCSPPGPSPKVGWPTEAKARWIIKREDDPEEESPQSNDETAEESPQSDDETAEKFAKLHDAEAEG